MKIWNSVIGILLCIYVILLPIVPDNFKYKRLPVLDCILGIIIIVYLLQIIINSESRKNFIMGIKDFFTDYLSIFMSILLVVMLISISYAVYKPVAASETARFLTYIALYFIIKYDIYSKRIRINIIICYLFDCVILSVFGIYQYFTGAYLDKSFYSVKRIASTLSNPNSFAAFLIIAIFPVIMLCINEKNNLRKILYLAIVGLLGTNVLLTGSRNAYIGLAVGCVVIAIVYNKKFLPVFGGAFVALMLIPNIRTRIMQIGDSAENQSRIKLWNLALEMFKDHPIRGVGNGNYVKLHDAYVKRYPQYYYYTYFKDFPSHNSYLKILSELGIIGFITFLALLISIILKVKKFIEIVNNKFYRVFYIGFLGSVIAFLVMNISDNLLFVPSVATYFWILLAISQSMLYKLRK